MSGWRVSSSSGAAARTPQCGPRNLYGEHDEQVRTEGGDVDELVRGVVHAVDVEQRAGGVCSVGDRPHRRLGAEQVRRGGDGDQPCPSGDGGLDGGEVDVGGGGVEVDPAHDHAGRPRPRRTHGPNVGIVIEPGHHDFVAWAPLLGDHPGEVEGELGRTAAVDDPAGGYSEQVGVCLPECGDGGVGVGLRRCAVPRLDSGLARVAAIVSATDRGACVPPGPSKCAIPEASDGNWDRSAATSKLAES